MGIKSPKIFLGLICGLAFFLRFWGIGFQAEEEFLEPAVSSWIEAVVSIYHGNIIPDINARNYSYFFRPPFPMYLTALGGQLYTRLAAIGRLGVYLSQHHTFSIMPVFTFRKAVGVARILSLLFGTGTVYLTYRMGKIIFDSKIGRLGALFLAVIPLHVAYSHRAGPTIISTFFISLAFFFCLKIAIRGGGKYYLLAGFFLGLAVGCSYSAAVLLLPLAGAHWLRNRQEGKGFRGLFLDRRLGGGLIALMVGLVISIPSFYTDFKDFGRYFPIYLRAFARGAPPGRYFCRRAGENVIGLVSVLGSPRYGLGLGMAILALGGVIRICLFPFRGRGVLGLLFFPSLILTIFFRRNLIPRDFTSLLPFLALLAAYFLSRSLDNLVTRKRLKTLTAALSVVLIIYPGLKRDVGLDYVFWRGDTRQLAEAWIKENIPPGSRIAREQYTPLLSGLEYQVSYSDYLYQLGWSRSCLGRFDYLISSRGPSRHFFIPRETGESRWIQKFYQSLGQGQTVLKTFRTEEIGVVSPVIKVHDLKREGPAWKWKTLILRDLDFDYSDTSPPLLTLEEDLGYEGKSGFWVHPSQPGERLVISPQKAERIGVLVYPTRIPAKVKLKMGGRKKKLTFNSAEPQICLFSPRPLFPFLKYSYCLKAQSRSEASFLIKILTSAHQLGRAFYLRGEAGKAEPFPADLSRIRKEGWGLGGETFEEWFQNSFGQSPRWWRDKYQRTFEAEDYHHQTGEVKADLTASGQEGMFFSSAHNRPRYLLFGQYTHLPPRPWIVNFRLKVSGEPGDEKVAFLDICADRGRRILNRRELSGSDFPNRDRYCDFPIALTNDSLANELEFRVQAAGPADLWCDKVEVYPDLFRWFRDYLIEPLPPS